MDNRQAANLFIEYHKFFDESHTDSEWDAFYEKMLQELCDHPKTFGIKAIMLCMQWIIRQYYFPDVSLTCDLNGSPNFKQPFSTMIGYYRWQNTPQKIKIETEKIIKELKKQNKIEIAKALEAELKANESLTR